MLTKLDGVNCSIHSLNPNTDRNQIVDGPATKLSKIVHKRQTPNRRNSLEGLGYPQEKFCVDVSKWSDIYYKINEKTVCTTEFKKQCIDRSEEVFKRINK